MVEFLRLFQLIKSFNFTEYFIAMALRVSPALTVCTFADEAEELLPLLELVWDDPDAEPDLDTRRTWPGKMVKFLRLFQLIKLLTVVECLMAMALKVSPDCTLYVLAEEVDTLVLEDVLLPPIDRT